MDLDAENRGHPLIVGPWVKDLKRHYPYMYVINIHVRMSLESAVVTILYICAACAIQVQHTGGHTLLCSSQPLHTLLCLLSVMNL